MGSFGQNSAEFSSSLPAHSAPQLFIGKKPPNDSFGRNETNRQTVVHGHDLSSLITRLVSKTLLDTKWGVTPKGALSIWAGRQVLMPKLWYMMSWVGEAQLRWIQGSDMNRFESYVMLMCNANKNAFEFWPLLFTYSISTIYCSM